MNPPKTLWSPHRTGRSLGSGHPPWREPPSFQSPPRKGVQSPSAAEFTLNNLPSDLELIGPNFMLSKAEKRATLEFRRWPQRLPARLKTALTALLVLRHRALRTALVSPVVPLPYLTFFWLQVTGPASTRPWPLGDGGGGAKGGGVGVAKGKGRSDPPGPAREGLWWPHTSRQS